MKIAVFGLVVALVAGSLLGCATVGEIPVALDDDRPIAISPANADGVQDSVAYDLVVTPLERTRIAGYRVTVTDADDTVVFEDEQIAEPAGFFARLFGRDEENSITPPRLVLWDGRTTDGVFVPDGSYTLSVTVWDDRDNSGSAGAREVVVDNTPPSVEVSAPHLLFTPDGDDRMDILPIYQRRSTREDEWVGEIVDTAGTTVRTFRWYGGARDFTWDGVTDSGPVAAEGTYRYRVSATDRAGNTGTFELTGITLERDPRQAALRVDRPVFSPNGDGRADTVTITPRVEVAGNLEAWTVDVRDTSGAVVREYRGTGTPRPVVFDGRSDDGAVVEDGPHHAVLTLTYRGGQEPQVASPPFVVDTTPPRAVVQVSSQVFSPDGDGTLDTVEIRQSSSDEREWIGTLTGPEEAVVLTKTWSGRVRNFVWDGTDDDGRPVPDATYTYELRSEDEAGNASGRIATRIRVDTRSTPVRITERSVAFSPNGDGVLDEVDLEIHVSSADQVSFWRVSIINPAGIDLGMIASGTEVPGTVRWDGRLTGAPAPDRQYVAELEVEYENGGVERARSGAIRLDTTPPEIDVSVTPELFSPDGDGTGDMLELTLTTRDLSPITGWSAELHDPDDRLFVSWSASGPPFLPIRWNGFSPRGELVQAVSDYRLVVTATDAVSNTGTVTAVVPTDIYVIRDGDRLRIPVANIHFGAYSPDFTDVEPELVTRNMSTLDRLATFLSKYPHHAIRIEGHAVQVYWDSPKRAATEQNEILIPLSLERADTVKEELVRRGISADRMTTVGYGGEFPVVPHGAADRWKNRRVEFVLERE